MLRGNAPSIYLPRVQKSSGYDDSRMEEILKSHVMAPDYLRRDDFDSFFKAREDALLRQPDMGRLS